MLLFKNHTPYPATVFHCAVALFHATKKAAMPEDNDRVHHILVTWDPPLARWCKPNCDGSWDEWETGGIGFVLRNASCLMCRCRKLLRRHILYCKTAAVRGLLLARQLRIQRIQVETGSKVLVELYKDDTPIPWKTQNLLRYICYILTHSFLEFWVNHVLREGNKPANWLANFARTSRFDCFWEPELPSDLTFLVHCNANRIGCNRLV